MSTTYEESIARFCDPVRKPVIDNLVKHLGIALQSADGETVAATDPAELKTIREGFCAKYLGLNEADADQAIQEVCDLMQHDTAKCRVTFYYLLADKAGKLDQFA